MSSVRPPQMAQRLVDAYITGLRQRLPTLCIRRLDQLPGASEQQLLKLRQAYPAAPPELLYMLQRVNGTYWEAIRANPSATMAAGGQGQGSEGEKESIAAPAPPASGSSAASRSAPSSSATAASKPKQSATAAAASFVKSAFQGPGRKPVNKEKLAVPILGSALGTCPYFLTTVEDIVAPFEQPFPPRRKSAPRQPSSEDVSTAAATTTSPPSSSPGAATDDTLAAPPQSRRNHRLPPPGSAHIEAIYANMNIVRGFAPGTAPPKPKSAKDEVAALEGEEAHSVKPFDPTRKTVYVDPRIDTRADLGQWLAFADSMLPHHQPWELDEDEALEKAENTKLAKASAGQGTSANPQQGEAGPPGSANTPPAPVRKASVSRLYIDFAPSELGQGVSGQVIQYSRGEPESFRVIAKDFGEYLKYLMTEEYAFTEELEDEDEDSDEDGDDADDAGAQHAGGGKGVTGGASDSARAHSSTTLTSPSGQPISDSAPSSASSSSGNAGKK